MRSKNLRTDLETRTYAASLSRVAVLLLGTAGMVAAVSAVAWEYIRVIPPGDATFRLVAFGWCGLLTVGQLFVAYRLFESNCRRSISIETGRLVIRDADTLVSSDWGGVAVGKTEQRLGVQYVDLVVAGRVRTMNNLFFPQLDEICSQVRARSRTFDTTTREHLRTGTARR